ncbi:signal peptidase I [Halovulum sp. GXIMD14793]
MAETKKKPNGIFELLKTIVYAVLLAALIRTLIFQPFWIPTGSMKPTLLIGDFLFVNKYAYGYSAYSCPNYGAWNLCSFWEGSESSKNRIWASEPERGDVVVFRHPVLKQDYIKRLVGLPGDTVETRDGVLYVNGTPAPQDPDGIFTEAYATQGSMGGLPICTNNPGLGAECQKKLAYETLPGGVKHAVLDARPTSLDNFGPKTVPEDHFFFMGDNRDNSADSRRSPLSGGVGMVHREYLVGRADRVIFSSAGHSILYFWTWRSDRYFKAIE